ATSMPLPCEPFKQCDIGRKRLTLQETVWGHCFIEAWKQVQQINLRKPRRSREILLQRLPGLRRIKNPVEASRLLKELPGNIERSCYFRHHGEFNSLRYPAVIR